MNKEKELLIQNIINDYLTKKENNISFDTFKYENYKEIVNLMTICIKNSDTTLLFDLKNVFQNIDFQSFNKKTIDKNYRFVRQGGADVYSYVNLRIEAISEPIIIIKENLPDFFAIFECPKNEFIEWIEVYPFIIKALLDYCLEHKYIGISFTLLDVRFHPVDYKNYIYYICTKNLLKEL